MCTRLFAIVVYLGILSLCLASCDGPSLHSSPEDELAPILQPSNQTPSPESPPSREPADPEEPTPPPTPDPLLMPPTTAIQTIEGVLPPSWQSNSDRHIFGLTQVGGGELHLVRNDLDLPAGSPPSPTRSSLAYLAHLSDMHLVDEESPSRAFILSNFSGTIYRRNESYTPHIFHAMLQTLNRFALFKPFDFAAITGDLIDNRQQNELHWFMQTIDGGLVNPDSGEDDDPIAGPENDPNDPYFSEGLDSRIPWYSTTGNHDLLFIGNMSTDTFVGDPTRSFSAKAIIPTCLANEDEAPNPVRCIVPPLSYFSMGWIVPDDNRAPIDQRDFVTKHLESTSLPAGHGFTDQNLAAGTAYWVADPHPQLPIRLIALDTIAPMGSEGFLSREQIDDFLIPQLQRAKDDEMLVILLTHHPSREILRGSELRELLHQNPNVILHLVGHNHRHEITPRPGDTPELGYWEIQTASLIDWPLQQRILEVINLGNGEGEIWSTVIDFETDQNHLAAAGRFYTLFEKQDHTSLVVPGDGGDPTDRNVILRIKFPEWLHPKLDSLAQREPTSPLFQIPRPQISTD